MKQSSLNFGYTDILYKIKPLPPKLHNAVNTVNLHPILSYTTAVTLISTTVLPAFVNPLMGTHP